MLSLKIIIDGHSKNIGVIVEEKKSKCIEFIESLGLKTKRRIKAIMKQMAERGEIRNEEMFRHLGDKIYEFKAGRSRVYCFFDKETVVCTHGAYKSKRKRTKTEIKKAKNLRKRFFEQKRY
jgi:hypothetical protein